MACITAAALFSPVTLRPNLLLEFKKELNLGNGGSGIQLRQCWNARCFSPTYVQLAQDVEGLEKQTENLNGAFQQELNQSSAETNDPQEEMSSDLEENDYNDDYVTRIPVSKQKYIPVSKTALVKSLQSAFDSEQDISDFLSVCSCLETILHAEHKIILEELRVDYKLIQAADHSSHTNNAGVPTESTGWGGEKDLFSSISIDGSRSNSKPSSVNGTPSERESLTPIPSIAATSRFQHNIMYVLKSAQFQELSVRDLELTEALNSDYLLTLPIEIDWKSTSSSNIIIFRRGYTTEKQEGFLFVEKLDYLQSCMLRRIFSGFAQPLIIAGQWIMEKWKPTRGKAEAKTWTDNLIQWLEEPLPQDMNVNAGDDLPTWIAGRSAIPRYEAVLSSAGSRGILIRRLLERMGILPPQFPRNLNLFGETTMTPEPHLRSTYISRISMRDIWLPASAAECGKSYWKMFRTAISIFFSRSALQEPAFQELVVLQQRKFISKTRVPIDAYGSILELNTYQRIPIPDIKVVFPNKKLSFRILDTLRLDIATIAGTLAFLINYRFDDLSSLSSFILDLISSVALLVLLTRVGLGYQQTWNRYQLLVNKTLYEKTLASAFGVVHFLVDASEEQQFKQAILLYGMLLQSGNGKPKTLQEAARTCECFMYNTFKEQIEMPVRDATETLLRLGLVVQKTAVKDKDLCIQAVPFVRAIGILDAKWKTLLRSQYEHYRF